MSNACNSKTKTDYKPVTVVKASTVFCLVENETIFLNKKIFSNVFRKAPRTQSFSKPNEVVDDWGKKFRHRTFFGFGVRPLSWFRKCHVTWNDVDDDVDDNDDDNDGSEKNSHSGPTNCQNAKRVCAKERRRECVYVRVSEREEEGDKVRECAREKSDSRKSGHLRRSDLYRRNFELKYRWRCGTDLKTVGPRRWRRLSTNFPTKNVYFFRR